MKRKNLLNLLENGMVFHHRLIKRQEERFWKPISPPCQLSELLILLTKNDLDAIRRNLNLKGISSLKKAELADELAKQIPANFKKVLFLLDKERYTLLKKLLRRPN